MAISNENDYVAALASAQRVYYSQAARTAVIGQKYSGWLTSTSPIAGATPTTWATCSSSTQGAIPFTNPTAPAVTRLNGITMFSTVAKCFELVIRHGACGGLSGTSVDAQTVNATAPTLGVLSDYSNVRWYVEIYSALGSSSRTLTVNYTDQDDQARTTTVSIPASIAATRILPIEPSGYYIKTITSVQLSGSTGTAGNFGITATSLVSGANNVTFGNMTTPPETGWPQIPDSACLQWHEICTIPTTGDAHGHVILVQG